MKNFSFTINGNKYDVEVKDIESNIAQIEVNGTIYEVEVHREVKKTKTPTLVRPEIQTKRIESKIKKNISVSSTVLKAPLPGVIMKIFVNQNDMVKKGQKLLMYEAMKMENELLATKDGVVQAIKVTEGENILEGQDLIEIK